MRRLTQNIPIMLSGLVAALCASVLFVSSANAAGDAKTMVKCPKNASSAEQCKVSEDVYLGWRTFEGNCARCHGETATGSTFAPSLFDRMKDMPQIVWEQVVKNGLKGQVGVMPAFKGNGNVTPYLDELYAYLHVLVQTKQLPGGRPEEMDE